uniref:U3 small nucleolar RNA-associated protein 11 n=1 Tax=Amblyomma aureolatum TaxID=187763 RepID=A0A1E1XAE2_9ACAR
MSSFAKAAKASQRIHKERQQPDARRHLGVLEKKKDYKLRARDYQNKQLRLKRLRQRALTRNPDEFYMHMVNSKLDQGEHHDRVKGEEFTPAQLKLMQTQDLNYVTTKRVSEAKKIARLKANLHLLGDDSGHVNTHTFFVDTKKEARNFDFAEKLGTHPSLLGRAFNRPKLETLHKECIADIPEDVIKEATHEMKKSYRELTKRLQRQKELKVVEQKMTMKKKLLDKKNPPVKKVKEGTKDAAPVYLWKKERKR